MSFTEKTQVFFFSIWKERDFKAPRSPETAGHASVKECDNLIFHTMAANL